MALPLRVERRKDAIQGGGYWVTMKHCWHQHTNRPLIIVILILTATISSFLVHERYLTIAMIHPLHAADSIESRSAELTADAAPVSTQNDGTMDYAVAATTFGQQDKNVTTDIQQRQGSTNRSTPHIVFELHQRKGPYSNPFISVYRCPLETSNSNETFHPLPDAFQKKGVLDFTTTISTNLRILVMGDSVGILFAQSLENAAGASLDHRRVLRYTTPIHEGLTISAPIRGGGVLASWRITGWLLRKAEGKELPNFRGGGWAREDVERLLNYTHVTTKEPSADGVVAVTSIQAMDALIFRIPIGWLSFGNSKVKQMRQTVDVAYDLFGIKTVIFVTAPFDNNINEPWKLEKFNQMVRNFCHAWKPPLDDNDGVQHVMFLDFSKLMHAMIERNAISLGRQVEGDKKGYYMLQRLTAAKSTDFPPSIAQVCAELPSDPNSTYCKRTVISSDGKHPCMETIGARVNAGLSCLLACAFNKHDHNIANMTFDTRICEFDCNEEFMSLLPISSL